MPDQSAMVFTAPFEREVRVSADRRTYAVDGYVGALVAVSCWALASYLVRPKADRRTGSQPRNWQHL